LSGFAPDAMHTENRWQAFGSVLVDMIQERDKHDEWE
jgi:hypothetical protein